MDFTAPGARILAVDDQEINLMVLERLLAPTQAEVTTAASGQEMLGLLAQEHFDIILLDHVMPPPDGLESFRLARTLAGNLNQTTPYIALTGNDMRGAGADPSLPPREATRAYYKAEGFADYLPKPVLPEDIEDALLSFLPEEKIVRPAGAADGANGGGGNAGSGSPTGAAGGTNEDGGEDAPSPSRGLLARAQELLEREGQEGGAGASSPDAGPIDFSRGLAFSAGDEGMYRELLKNWADAYMENGYTIQKSAKGGDLNAHRIATHSLKSSSRMVGAMALGELSEKAEHAARDGDLAYIQTHCAALLAQYGAAVEAANGYLSD